MIDFSSLAQWLNANKGNISTAVDAGVKLYDEVSGRAEIKEREMQRLKKLEEERERERKRLISLREKEEKKIHDICLPLIFRAAKYSVTSTTMIARAKIDYAYLQSLLKQQNIIISIINMRLMLPLCNLSDLANMIAIHECDKRKIKPLSTEI